MDGFNEEIVKEFLGVSPKYTHAVVYSFPVADGIADITFDTNANTVSVELWLANLTKPTVFAKIHRASVSIEGDPLVTEEYCLAVTGNNGSMAISPSDEGFHISFNIGLPSV